MFSFTGPMPIYFTDRDMEKIIQTIKEQYPNIEIVTLPLNPGLTIIRKK